MVRPITPEDRAFVFVEWAKRSAANGWAAAWDPDTGGGESFGTVELSDDGGLTRTHTGINTVVDSQIKTAILDAAENVPFSDVYLESDGWTWDSALADLGLVPVLEETP